MSRKVVRYPLLFTIFLLLGAGLLLACAAPQQAQDPAGTSTQDPPLPQLTQATHGILDTTGTVPQNLLAQLRQRSDTAESDGYQIAVVFFNNLASDPHQFATAVFNAAGIGYKDTNNGVLFVLYLQKPGTDGHTPWLSYITGAGISGALPDTLMDDYAQSTFVAARAQGHWQEGLLAFYDKVFVAEQDPNIAREWQSQQSQRTGSTPTSDRGPDPVLLLILAGCAIGLWLVSSAVVASRRHEQFFPTAFRLLGRFFLLLFVLSKITGGGSSSRKGSWGGGSGRWGGGGRSPSSGGDV